MSDSAENTDSHEGLGDGKETRFLVHNFTFLMLREDDYVVSPKSMAFLVDNGFDFNKQFQDGILYKPGNDEEIANPVKAALDSNHIMRSIFHHVLERNVPVCLHNGLLDLLFLYQSFYAELPAQLGSFNADLTEMFPGGLYDTKYIAEFVTREKASFLAYLFRKYERDHLERNLTKRKDYLCFEIQQRLPSIEKKDTPLPSVNPKRPALDTGKPYCEQYAAHGYCNEGRHCHRTHDLDLILDEVDVESTAGKATRRRKRQKMMEAKKALESDGTSQSDSVSGMQAAAGDDKEERKTNLVEMSTAVSTASVAPALPPSSPAIISGPDPKTMSADASLFEKYHSACFDAYMTGFIFAHQCLEYPSHREEHRNRMYLMGKQIPLLLSGSNFSKTSKNHQQKRSRLKPAYLVNVKEEAGK
ncbi:Target of EGR1, member 1 (Nuclear) [Borealophlyctis nickersoniae]|nr:Target of EGR1, member 1 (Nuclear) [Borealophlyctis nickersoniae]